MKINQNISAVVVNEQLLRNENSLSESIRRLSSGFKFNNPKDSPSGVAISYKMQAQINALDRANANATDGTSIVQTIDGAMGELTEVIQRMRELCVQAANDTNTWDDRESIQQEIDALKKEVDRISSDTEFNGKKLLDGSLDRRSYATETDANGNKVSVYSQIENLIVSDNVQAGHYAVTIESNPKHAELLANAGHAYPGGDGSTINISGKLKMNGYEIEITEDMTPAEVYQALRDGGDIAGVNVFARTAADAELNEDTLDSQGYEKEEYTAFTQQLTFVSEKYGSTAKVEITGDSDLLDALGIPTDPDEAKVFGEDVKASVDITAPGAKFSPETVVTMENERVTITDRSGFQIDFEVRGDFIQEDNSTTPATLTSRTIDLEVTDMGTLQLQIGANEDQELAVRVPVLNTRSLYITDLDVTKVEGADEGITKLDVALSIVTDARSKIGAYENSLERVESSLEAIGEDMTAALSRLEDTDMAKEMTNYTNLNVLSQASTSILGQANDMPQQVLSLLQF